MLNCGCAGRPTRLMHHRGMLLIAAGVSIKSQRSLSAHSVGGSSTMQPNPDLGLRWQDCLPDGPPAGGVLLIAGGIGITPLRSMFAHFVDAGAPVTLLYCVRQLADVVFLQEFAQVPCPIPCCFAGAWPALARDAALHCCTGTLAAAALLQGRVQACDGLKGLRFGGP